MKIFHNRKIALLAAVLVLGMALAPYAHALELHHHSMDMSDCSTSSAHCLACGNPLPSRIRIEHSLSPCLDAMVPLSIPKVTGPAVSHYHPPG
jgi:hypothetical protein